MEHRHNPYITLILAGLMVFIIALSFFIFSRQSLRLDEAQSLWQVSHTPTKILNIIAQDVHVPLYHFLLHFWQFLVGNSVFSGRVVSLIFFVLSIPTLYMVGKRAFSPGVSLFATTLFAISPFMNWYGNEIRMYSLMTFFTILSHYFFILIYKDRSRDAWAWYFLISLLGIFTHYFFFFILLVQAIFYFVYHDLFPKKSFRKFAVIAGIIIAIFSPWLLYVRSINTVSNAVPVLAPPTSVNVFNMFSQFIFGFQTDHLNTILVSLWPLTVLLGFLALRNNKKVPPEATYLLLSILVPIISAFVVSVTIRPLFVARYLIVTIPALYLFVAWIFSTYPATLQRVLGTLLILAMLGGLTVEIISPHAPVKENYYDVALHLQANAKPQDIIILSPPFTVYPVEYYYRGQTGIATLPIWNRFVTGPIPAFNESSLAQEINILKDSHEKAWLLLSYDQGYEETIRIYMDTRFERLTMKTFSPGLTLYEYRLRYDPRVLTTK